jgi:hypothetical protein
MSCHVNVITWINLTANVFLRKVLQFSYTEQQKCVTLYLLARLLHIVCFRVIFMYMMFICIVIYYKPLSKTRNACRLLTGEGER